MKKFIYATVIVTVATLGCLYFLKGYPLILMVTELDETGSLPFEKGDILEPLEKFDFESDDWEAIIVLGSTDIRQLSPTIAKHRCLKTTDKDILNKMKSEWVFEVTGGDMSTVESFFYLFKKNQLVFKTGIVLEDQTAGLQNESFGWIEHKHPASFLSTMQGFERVFQPIIIL